MEAGGKFYIVHSSRSDVFEIYNFADIHYGTKGCDLERFRKDVQYVKSNPYAFWFGGGDYIDCIGYHDTRFDPDCVSENVSVKDLGNIGQVLIKAMREELYPIKDKGLGLLCGNHEKKYETLQEQKLLDWLCVELGVPNFQYCVMFDVVFVRMPGKGVKKPYLTRTLTLPSRDFTKKSFRIFAHHGAGFATTPGGKLNKLIQFMDSFDALIYFCAHVHDQKAQRMPSLAADPKCKNIIQRERLGIITGSYYKTYKQGMTSYGEQRGYRPVPLGASYVKINPETGTFTAEI